MKALLPRIAVPLLLTLLAACTFRPSVEEIRAQRERQWQADGYADLFTIENFTRINGHEPRDNVYVAEVEYDLVFRKGYRELADELKQSARDAPMGVFLNAVGLLALQMQYGDFKAGQRVHRKESLRLIRTEKGWRILEDED